jgi:hypothetical protein
MQIQINTDKTVDGNQRTSEHFSTLIADELKHYSNHITRIEAHLSDENGSKEGFMDIRCLLEARIEGMQPIAATDQADSIEKAVSGALAKLKAGLDSKLGKRNEH